MEDQCSPLTLSWAFCNEEEGMEELRRSFFLATLELQKTILTARDEITRRENEVIRLKGLLSKTLKERDAAHARCEKLVLEKLCIEQQQQQQQQQQQLQLTTTIPLSLPLSSGGVEIDFRGPNGSGFSPTASNGSLTPSQSSPMARPLPEKGKLLKAVIEAGPLLQTLLLAGPLPQWESPPPQLDRIEIPPMPVPPFNCGLPLLQDSCTIGIMRNGCFSKKRGLLAYESSDSTSSPIKYQRLMN